jgi:hypothetical protein
MESNIKLNSPQPQVLPAPTTVPETEPLTRPHEEPDENDPFNVPGPKVDPTPKGKKSF